MLFCTWNQTVQRVLIVIEDVECYIIIGVNERLHLFEKNFTTIWKHLKAEFKCAGENYKKARMVNNKIQTKVREE